MKLSRLDLDGAASPSALVARILQIERDLPVPVPIEQLCERLDIVDIGDLHTEGFEAALITDAVKSQGAILVAKNRPRQRRRFSIGHELGHFLISSHLPPPGEPLLCSADQFHMLDTKDQDRRRRMEAEANRFAALLLMPPPRLREELQRIRLPAITDIVRLAKLFDVSKEAMARGYVDFSRQPVAVVVIRSGRVLRFYRNPRHFPWIAIAPGMAVPDASSWYDRPLLSREVTEPVPCETDTWFDEGGMRQTLAMTEQVLGQAQGYSMVMLVAEMRDDDDDRPHDSAARFR